MRGFPEPGRGLSLAPAVGDRVAVTTSLRSGRATPPPPPTALPGFVSVPAGLVGDLVELPFDLYLRVGGNAVLYARRDADPAGIAGRGDRALTTELAVRDDDGPNLRATLLASLVRATDALDGPAVAQARRVASLTAALIEPAFAVVTGPAGAGPDRRAATATASAAARLAGRAVERRPRIAGLLLERPIVAAAARHCYVERAIDGIAIGAALGRVLETDPLAAAEAGALRDILLIPGAGPARAAGDGGQHALAASDRVLAAGGSIEVAMAIAAHHERLDGSGQPAALRAEALGSLERITALVDVLVAMTRREGAPGAAGLPIGEAFRALRMTIAGRFDGRVILALAGLMADGTLGSSRAVASFGSMGAARA